MKPLSTPKYRLIIPIDVVYQLTTSHLIRTGSAFSVYICICGTVCGTVRERPNKGVPPVDHKNYYWLLIVAVVAAQRAETRVCVGFWCCGLFGYTHRTSFSVYKCSHTNWLRKNFSNVLLNAELPINVFLAIFSSLQVYRVRNNVGGCTIFAYRAGNAIIYRFEPVCLAWICIKTVTFEKLKSNGKVHQIERPKPQSSVINLYSVPFQYCSVLKIPRFVPARSRPAP